MFLRVHFLLTVVVIIVVWIYLVLIKKPGRLLLKIGISLWLIITIVHSVLVVVRNISQGRFFASTKVTTYVNVLRVQVKVPRLWHVKAGQYIFINIPGASITSAIQAHPFIISW